MNSSLPIYELAAVATAMCWAVTSLMSSIPAGHLGAFAFSRLRQTSVTAFLAIIVLFTGAWCDISAHAIGVLMLSGILGIFIGDTLLFTCVNRLGPRRAGILFALNAPMAAILGWLFLGETLSVASAAGVALTALGVMLAVLFGKRPGQTSKLEQVQGNLGLGIAIGLGAALGQALGSLTAKPIMATGIDPFAASMFRVGAAALCLNIVCQLPLQVVKARAPLNLRIATIAVASGILAMGIGMTLLLYALGGGKTGVVSTLSATSPVMFLPLLWLTTGQRPAAGAWIGAFCVVIGMGLIFLTR